MAKLKCVICSLENVVGASDGKLHFEEFDKLVALLQKNGVRLAFLTNRSFTITLKDKTQIPAEKFLKDRWGDVSWFTAGKDVPFAYKESKQAIPHVLNVMGVKVNEAISIGNSEADMRSAVNGGMLFLNACWFEKSNDYGFQFKSTKEMARFFNVFCFRDHWWHFEINAGNLKVRSLAPYGTRDPEYSLYTEDMIDTAKKNAGHADFWAKYLCTSMYFSGLFEEVQYFTSFPGHEKGTSKPILDEPLSAFAKCFRAKFLSDLIVRHTTAPKAAYNRKDACHAHQLHTTVLNPNPQKSKTAAYVRSPLGPGKTVLVLDDVCTQGFSFEAARVLIEQTGAKVICVSWLKTMFRGYEQLEPLKFDSFKPTSISPLTIAQVYPYESHITNKEAPAELDRKFKAYPSWDWPS